MKVFVVLSAVLACALSQVAYPYAFSPFGYNTYNAIPYNAYHRGVYHYSTIHAPLAVAAPVVVPTSSQYHAQDELGQFTFGTAGDNQARVETKTVDGTVTGAYSYVDPTGKPIHVNYQADHNGFRVLGANNLPVAPEVPDVAALSGPEPIKDTPEVVAARAAFLKKFAKIKAAAEAASAKAASAETASAETAPVVPALSGPEPIKDTPEVVAARTAFLKKFAKIKAAAEAALAEAAPETKSRKRRQAVFYSTPLIAHPTPILAKSTLKYKTFEPVDAKVPADTKKIELKDKETEITHAVAPLAYSAVVPTIYNSYYGVPALRSPYFYHI